MNKEQTIETIKVMQAYVDGKEIECDGGSCGEDWFLFSAYEEPAWNFPECKYRIKKNSHSINWNEVSDEYNYLWVDSCNSLLLSQYKPVVYINLNNETRHVSFGEGSLSKASIFKSAKKGDDVLEIVCRPGFKG